MSLKTANFFNSLLQTHIYQTKIYKMKQKFLSILSLVMITAVTANAQVATNYRGAFAPAPVAQWTDNWTNWDPQNTFYPAPTDSVQGIITTSQTLSNDKVYIL